MTDNYAIFNTKDYWCSKAGSYWPDAQGVGYRDFPINDIWAEYILSKKPESVIDVGCGGGYLVQKLRKYKVDAWGIDISSYCFENYAPPEVKPYLVLGNIADMSMFRDKQFDMAVNFGVLEHLTPEDVEKACKEIVRISKRGIIAPCLSTELSANLPKERLDKTHCTMRDFYWWKAHFPPEFEIWEGAEETWVHANKFKVLVVAPMALPVGDDRYGGIERLAFLIARELVRRGIATTLVAGTGSKAPWGVELLTPVAPDRDYISREAMALTWVNPCDYSVVLDLSHSKIAGRLRPYDSRQVSIIWHAPPIMKLDLPQYNIGALSNWQAETHFYSTGRKAKVIDVHTLDDIFFPIKGGERFLAVGKINARKGLLEAIGFCKKLGVGLDVVGPLGEDETYNQAVLSQCKGSIEYLGELPNKTVLMLAAQARALLYPGNEPEAHSHKSVEAQGQGLACILYNRYGWSEVVEHGVTGLLANGKEEFVKYMKDTDKLDRKTIREKAIERWGAKAVGDRLVPELIEVSRGARW